MIIESLYHFFNQLIFYQNHFVMHAIEETENIYNDLTPVEPPALLFKVVVNNYRQQQKDHSEERDDIDTPMISPEYGLPPQPVRYIKYPKYDWF
jgi:hypothetical protein